MRACKVQDLKSAASRFRGIIVLTDPDVAGRQARRQLDDALPGCLHAFLPSPLATASAATKWVGPSSVRRPGMHAQGAA